MNKDVYLTKDGVTRLKEELNTLVHKRRKEVIGRIEDAKELGDLSENAEYQEAKDEQSFIEGRIMEIESILKSARVVENTMSGRVGVGSTVIAKNGAGDVRYMIVGSSEADPLNNKISNESPIGQAFLGAAVGDTVTVSTPGGERKYTVTKIE